MILWLSLRESSLNFLAGSLAIAAKATALKQRPAMQLFIITEAAKCCSLQSVQEEKSQSFGKINNESYTSHHEE